MTSVLNTRAARQRERQIQDRLIRRLSGEARMQLRKEFVRVNKRAAELLKSDGRSALNLAMREHERIVVKILDRMYKKIGEAMGRRLLNAAKSRTAQMETKDTEGVLDRTIQRFISVFSPKRASQIAGVTRRQINTAVTQGLSAGESFGGIASRLVKSGIPRVRAWRIARTESHSVGQGVQNEMALSLDLGLKKVWVATQDERTRDTHDSADGQKVDMNESFSVNGADLRFPGDPSGPAGEIINCRCVVIYEE